jgi:predicted enzyme related to lactoylglutathione lyase
MPDSIAMVVIRGQDLAALRRFYHAVFGWESYEVTPDYAAVETVPHEHDEHGNDLYPPVELTVQGGAINWRYQGETGPARIHQQGPYIGISSGEPAATPYVEVVDLAATLAKVEAAGGSVVQPITEIPNFTSVARFADPEGTVIGLQQQVPFE